MKDITDKLEILDLFVNNILQFVFWKDRDSVFQGCNHNFAKHAELDNPKQIIGKTDYDLPWSKEESDFYRKIDQEVMTSGSSQLNFEEQITLKDGTTLWLSTSKIPLFDNKRKVIGILCWYIDITPYKSLQLRIDEKDNTLLDYSIELKKSNKALELANHDMELFTYAVSHDLKSPIRSIVGFTDLILKTRRDKIDDDTLIKLKFILDSGINMENLVNNILSYARIGLTKFTKKQIHIKSFLSGKLSDIDQIVLNRNAIVNLDFPDSLISCHPEFLGMVFYNLISNGLKYNKSEKATVNCTMKEYDTGVTFTVSDNGIGIESKFFDTIFEPFQRLHSSKIEGTGLGLSICKRIVELHNGKIWIDNSKNGTTIKFSISNA